MTSLSCIYFSRFEAGGPSVSLLVVDSMDCVGWVVSENLTGERAYDFLFGRAISALFAAADQGIGLNAHFFVRASLFFVARFTLSQPSTPLRNATNLRTFCFGLSSCLSRDFCQNQRVLCSLIYTGPAVNSREECKVQENLSSHEKNIWLYFRRILTHIERNIFTKIPLSSRKQRFPSESRVVLTTRGKATKMQKGR